jgi:hypothetical protein
MHDLRHRCHGRNQHVGVIRAQIFLDDLKRMDSMPNLMLVQLPSNHTNGTDPAISTPQAMVADNDYALGQIVEGLSKSKFWPRMAIFIVEDDAQNGVDRVNGHRTVALAVSPYARRGQVDSTFHSTQSMVKTIELILGLPVHVPVRPDRGRHARRVHNGRYCGSLHRRTAANLLVR